MKIYVAHSTGFDYKNELYLPIRKSELNTRHEFILPHELGEERFNSRALFASGVDLVVAEVSCPSTGLGIELGWASANDIPIVCFYNSGSTPSGSLRAVTDKIVEYATVEGLMGGLQSAIQDS